MTNARKSRERHRMEEKEIADKQFEEERIKVMRENFQVFDCSGNQEHDPECDGNCAIVDLDEQDVAIAKETMRWAEVGMPPPLGTIFNSPFPGIPVDTFHLENSHVALLNIIREKGIATDDELNTEYKKVKLDRMTTIRERNEERVKDAQRMAQIAAPGSNTRPQLILPDNVKRKMH